jgi:hypothetical protein
VQVGGDLSGLLRAPLGAKHDAACSKRQHEQDKANAQ